MDILWSIIVWILGIIVIGSIFLIVTTLFYKAVMKFSDELLDILDAIIKFIVKVSLDEAFRWIVLIPISLTVYLLIIEFLILNVGAGFIFLFIGYVIAPNNKRAVIHIFAIISILVVPILSIFGIGVLEMKNIVHFGLSLVGIPSTTSILGDVLGITNNIHLLVSLVPIPGTLLGLYFFGEQLDIELANKYNITFSKYRYYEHLYNKGRLKDYHQTICQMINENEKLMNKKFSNWKMRKLKKEFIKSVYHLENCLSQIILENYDDISAIPYLTKIKINHSKDHLWSCFCNFMSSRTEISIK